MKRNPYRITFDRINRFRGLADPDGLFNTSESYALGLDNLTSNRIGQLDNRDGQDNHSVYVDTIYSGGRRLPARYIGEGGNLWVDSVGVIPRPGIIDYPPPSEWDYPLPDDPPFDIIAPPLGNVTCNDLWEVNTAMSAYETDGNGGTVVTDSTSPCWEITCQDMWDILPAYSAYEATSNASRETTQTGGTLPQSECWDIQLNCKQLYALHPEWDKYRKEGGSYPDCWDFDRPTPDPTCQDYYDKFNTPGEYRSNGTYPDCIAPPEPPLPPPYWCVAGLESFTTNPSTIEFLLEDGYDPAEEAKLVTVVFVGKSDVRGTLEATASWFAISSSNGLTSWELLYSDRNRLPGTCRNELIGYYSVTPKGGL